MKPKVSAATSTKQINDWVRNANEAENPLTGFFKLIKGIK